MPYITNETRQVLNKVIDDLIDELSKSDSSQLAGNCNYTICRLLVESFTNVSGRKYRTFNEIVGVLESAKLELYRRLVAPYEDAKIDQNGDVDSF